MTGCDRCGHPIIGDPELSAQWIPTRSGDLVLCDGCADRYWEQQR